MALLRPMPTAVGLMILAATGLTGCSEAIPESTGSSPVAVTVSKPLVKHVTDFEYFTGQSAAVESVEARAGERFFYVIMRFGDKKDAPMPAEEKVPELAGDGIQVKGKPVVSDQHVKRM